MATDTDELVARCIPVLAEVGIPPDELDRRVLLLTADPMMARRLIVWIPEAFGLVLVAHIGKVQFANTFSALDRDDTRVTLEVSREPIVAAAAKAAMAMFHTGPRESFESIAGASLDGAQVSGPALIDIPAEVYEPR